MPKVKQSKAMRREWIGLAVIALPCLLYSMDLTVLNLAVPVLSQDLQPSTSQLLWIVDIYGFLLAGFLITMGTLGDRIGRRRLLLIGAAAFGITSVLAAFSKSAEMLIATRALLGIAGATLAPSTLSLIRNMFHDPKQRSFAIGIWIASFSVGAVIGPVVGGLLLEFFWWGSVFLVAVPVMIMLLILGPLLLPEFKDPKAGRFDLFSAMLSLFAVLSIIYGLKQIAQDGWQLPFILIILSGMALGAWFIHRQRSLAKPLIDLKLFRTRAFNASLVIYSLGIFMLFGPDLFIAQYLQSVLGLSPLTAGLWLVPSAMAFVIASMLTPVFVRWIRPALLMAVGFIVAAIGFAMIALAGPDIGLAMLVTSSVIFSIGLTPIITLAVDMIIGSAPPERAGAASGISETGAEFGGALGIALLGSVGLAVYRGQLQDNLPAGIPSESVETAVGTLGGALSVAEQLPGQLGALLTEAARQAFTEGLRTTAMIAGFTSIGLAVFTMYYLNHVRTSAAPELHEDE